VPDLKPSKTERLWTVFKTAIVVAEIVYLTAICLVLAFALYFIVEVA
jgi:hypothetical protein